MKANSKLKLGIGAVIAAFFAIMPSSAFATVKAGTEDISSKTSNTAGTVKYDSGYTANVTVNSGATWNLTANTSVCSIVNNGTINTNGHTLTYTSLSGNGTINEGTGIEENETETTFNDGNIYTIDGRCLGKSLPDDFQGVYIQNGKKLIKLR